MPANISKIAPTHDLGEFLKRIETDYNGKCVGMMAMDADTLGMLMESNLKKAGIIKKSSYKVDTWGGAPKVTRDEEYEKNLNYLILEVRGADDLLEDDGERLVKALDRSGSPKFLYETYEKDGSVFILMEMVDEDGNLFDDARIKKLEEMIG